MNDSNNWSPPPGDPNPMRQINGQWFNIGYYLEQECIDRGGHKWGPDKYAGDDGDGGPDPTMGYHHCVHCYRCEPL